MTYLSIDAEIPANIMTAILLADRVTVTLSVCGEDWTVTGKPTASESHRGYSQFRLADGSIQVEPEPIVSWKVVLEGETYVPPSSSIHHTRPAVCNDG